MGNKFVIPLYRDGGMYPPEDPEENTTSIDQLDNNGDVDTELPELRRVHLAHDEMQEKRARLYSDLRWGSTATVNVTVPAGVAVPFTQESGQLVRLGINPPRACVLALIWTPASTDTFAADTGNFIVDFLLQFGVGQSAEKLIVSTGVMVAPAGIVQRFLPLPQLMLPVRDLQVSATFRGTSTQLGPAPGTPITFVSRVSAYAAPVALEGLGGSTG